MHVIPDKTLDLVAPLNSDHFQGVGHRPGPLKEFARKLADWRESMLMCRALQLAGQPNCILDLPCGAGKFWPLLMKKANRIVVGADHSGKQLAAAKSSYPEYSPEKIRILQTSAFDIDLPDCAVDCVMSLRLFPQIAEAEHRLMLLREFHRVSRDSVILALWVDGNYKAWRRQRLAVREKARGETGHRQRFVVGKDQIEREFEETGFDLLGHYDRVPFHDMWRIYVLRKR